MKRKNRIQSMVLLLILALLLTATATASGSNTLTIYKVVNASGSHLLHEYPIGASTPMPDAIYRIWRVGDVDRSTDQGGYDAQLAQLNTLSVTELDETYPDPKDKLSAPTDANGKTVFADLPEGRYYVREVEEKGGAYLTASTSIPFLVDLPYLLDGKLLSELSVHPKANKPEIPDEPDEPPEGGEKFIKVDDKGVGLEGARFKLMQRVKDEEGKIMVDASGAYIYEPVLRDGKESILVSGKDGRFEIKGLDYGVYWLVETTAPEGYQLLKEPLEFVVSESSYEDAVIFRIINKPKEPDKPDKPDEPDKPDKPVKPDEPDKPVKPDEPVKPKPPVTPTKPTTPSKVVIPETGDVELYLFMVSGFALILLGAWITRDAQAK